MRKAITLITTSSAVAVACLFLTPVLSSAEPCLLTHGDGQTDGPKYVGSGVCRKCHGDQHKDWKKTKMAKAFDLLKPGERAEEKKAAGLDPKTDYTKDVTCLPCHVTGWGKPGGYAIPPEGKTPKARKAQKAAKAMQGVQCEACHGPASDTSAFKKENQQYRWEDLEQTAGTRSGMIFPTADNCTSCHNAESPFVDEKYVFDFEKSRKEGTHMHMQMEFDHGCPHVHKVTEKKKKK
jgi:Cytochrome c554 and c-prime